MTIELFFKIAFFVIFFGFAYMMTAYSQKAKARKEDKATRVKMHNGHKVPPLLKLRQTFGIPFTLAFWCGLAIIVSVIAIRVPEEEKLLIEQFGDEYHEYKNHTGSLLPKFN